MRFASIWLSALLLLINASTTAVPVQPNAEQCASRADLAGPCFEVRGRLSFWNGTPSARIWRVGTKRMLGVHGDELPPALIEKIDGFDDRNRFDTEAWATFRVCPFTRSRPGRMQLVCVESWRGLSLRPRTQNLP